MEKLSKKVMTGLAVGVAALGIASSNIYAQTFGTEKECEKSIKKITAKVIASKAKETLFARDNNQQTYAMNLSIPSGVILEGFPVGKEIEFPLERCVFYSGLRLADFYISKHNLFSSYGKVEYARDFLAKDLKLVK